MPPEVIISETWYHGIRHFENLDHDIFQDFGARILGDSISKRNCPFFIILFISIISIILIICEQMFAFVRSLCYTIRMKTNIIKYRTCVCNINYHVVWCVKHRKKIITPQIEQLLKDLAQEIARDKGFTVHLFEAGEMDHIYCFVSAPPKLSITDIVKYLKGITGRKLFEAYPELRKELWKGQLWNHSYYVETVGSVSEDAVRKYIENQSKSY